MRHPSGNIKQIPGSEFREEFQTRDKKIGSCQLKMVFKAKIPDISRAN